MCKTSNKNMQNEYYKCANGVIKKCKMIKKSAKPNVQKE